MIKKVILSNFRNFSFFQKEFDKINVIKGKNGTGKTNLLEAIYFCLNGHPFFKNLNRIKKDPNKPTHLNSNLTNDTIHITIEENVKKIKLNGKLAKVIDLKKQFPCIDYSINSFISFKNKDYIFSLIDRGIFSQDKTIIDKVLEYKKLTKIKKNLIKEENSTNKNAINMINDKLIETIKDISKKRTEFIDSIEDDICACFNKFHRKKLHVSYIEGGIKESTLKEELIRKKTLISLKKDTLKITVNDMDIFLYSSVGERKIILLCIVLAVLKMYNSHRLLPVFLVDDLEGDLDKYTQKMAFKIIESLPNQTFITTLGSYDGYNIINLTEELRS